MKNFFGMIAMALMAILAASPAHAALDLTTFAVDVAPVETLALTLIIASGLVWVCKVAYAFISRRG